MHPSGAGRRPPGAGAPWYLGTSVRYEPPVVKAVQYELRSDSAGRNLSEEIQREVEVGMVTTPARLARASGRVTQLLSGRW
jgi:hypothetical protein